MDRPFPDTPGLKKPNIPQAYPEVRALVGGFRVLAGGIDLSHGVGHGWRQFLDEMVPFGPQSR